MTPSADILLATKMEIERLGVETEPQTALAPPRIEMVELEGGIIFLFLREPQVVWYRYR